MDVQTWEKQMLNNINQTSEKKTYDPDLPQSLMGSSLVHIPSLHQVKANYVKCFTSGQWVQDYK